ncbi:MAG: S-methyl-5-thioribose-1-phosphate isomerase [Lachnospiraceae bacterium]|nr:S-methyl-5-thioribose-1-phosphate isomerase [Lachnospiraceae bacterium]
MRNKYDHMVETVDIDENGDRLLIIDQTLLPGEIKVIGLKDIKDIREAIYLLKVRGAPAIGVAAAIGIYVVSKNSNINDRRDFDAKFRENAAYLNSARPTAVNLSRALERMEKVLEDNKDIEVCRLLEKLKEEALKIKEEDTRMCRSIGENALGLLKKGDTLLTHCNAGQLATSKYGTATAVMYLGKEKGYDFRIYCDETRPLLQGARLTAYELSCAGMDVTLCCDNMVASLMRQGVIDAVFVGCDRVASNGDVANKIGTSVVATVAARYKVPFYVCAPSSTIDPDTATGDDIVIEQRPGAEVTDMWYEKRMAPDNIKVYNPAFDITDNELITAIITEKGIYRAPYFFGREFI